MQGKNSLALGASRAVVEGLTTYIQSLTFYMEFTRHKGIKVPKHYTVYTIYTIYYILLLCYIQYILYTLYTVILYYYYAIYQFMTLKLNIGIMWENGWTARRHLWQFEITWTMCSHAKINACTFFVIQMYVWRTATSEQQAPVALLYTKYKLLVHPQQTQTSSMHIYVYSIYTDTYVHQTAGSATTQGGFKNVVLHM